MATERLTDMRALASALVIIATATLAACGSDGGGVDVTDPGGTARIEIVAQAGPTCPVQQDPPAGECGPAPVAGAVVVLTDPAGAEIARGTTDASGALALELAAGAVTVAPQPVDGLLGTAPPIDITIVAGQTLVVTVDYDTGIR